MIKSGQEQKNWTWLKKRQIGKIDLNRKKPNDMKPFAWNLSHIYVSNRVHVSMGLKVPGMIGNFSTHEEVLFSLCFVSTSLWRRFFSSLIWLC